MNRLAIWQTYVCNKECAATIKSQSSDMCEFSSIRKLLGNENSPLRD